MHHILKRYERRFVKIVTKIINQTRENFHSRIQKILKIWKYVYNTDKIDPFDFIQNSKF